MIPKKPAPDLIWGGYRFSACAKPWPQLIVPVDASAGEGRSEKIMLKQEAKAKYLFNQNHLALANLIVPHGPGCKGRRSLA
ncbi:MAG TPA: hypothetical protein VER26_00565 [Xanthobacteraceae bacterium]|jgi:hypothetical protein|nr:hypothetical protein [Xanthobacteraceae bacterium]